MLDIHTQSRNGLRRKECAARLRKALLPLLFVVLLVCGAAARAAERVPSEPKYTLAVVPQFPPSVIKRDWMPLLNLIRTYAGIRLDLKFYRSIPEFENAFLKGLPDFVYLNPYHATMARREQGYIPLLRDRNALVGILVVRKDSPIRSIRDLRGKKLAFPSPNAFAASLHVRELLTDREKVPFTARYVTTHSNVYRHVALGKAAAGGGVNKTLSKEPQELRDVLRVIYRTSAVASHPLCAHPRVPKAVRQSLVRAVLRIADNSTGRELLTAVEMGEPVRADYERDYEMLELLGLERFSGADAD